MRIIVLLQYLAHYRCLVNVKLYCHTLLIERKPIQNVHNGEQEG